MDRVVACFEAWVGAVVERAERINCHHNYTEQETALRQGGVALAQGRHRRRSGGARADPGCMGTRVLRRGRARATAVALNSSPHGAGREYSPARRRADASPRTSCARPMDGIEYRDTDAFIDEIPGAYKDIDA